MLAQISCLITLNCCLIDRNIRISQTYGVLNCNIFLEQAIHYCDVFVFGALKYFNSRVFRCLITCEVIFMNLHARECVDINSSGTVESIITIEFDSSGLHKSIFFEFNGSASPSLIILEESQLQVHLASLAVNNSSISPRIIFKN